MKILYILSGTGVNGGATKSFLNMADRVSSAGNDVYVIVPDERGITQTLRDRGWSVKAIPYTFCSLPALKWNIRDIVRFFPRLIKSIIINNIANRKALAYAEEENIDIVHDNTSVTAIGHAISRGLDLPHVIHVREYGWKDFRLVLPGLTKRLKAKNTHIVAITEDLARFRGDGIDKSRVHVIYNGVVDDSQHPYFDRKERFFLYAGRIEGGKGVDDLMDAYVIYADEAVANGLKPIPLKLAGAFVKGGIYNKLTDTLRKSGLQDYVEFLGVIDDMRGYYAHAAATVVPSRNEGFGRVMPEAISAGSLCIVRNAGGLKEQLSNGRRLTGRDIGLQFDTVSQLAGNLMDIHRKYEAGNPYASGGEYFRMIEAGRKTVSALYSCKANANSILKLYDDIMSSGL